MRLSRWDNPALLAALFVITWPLGQPLGPVLRRNARSYDFLSLSDDKLITSVVFGWYILVSVI